MSGTGAKLALGLAALGRPGYINVGHGSDIGSGKDPESARGENAFDRFYGDKSVTPNPCMAPIEKPPFYGIEVYPGELGTKGGLKVDERARVLTAAGDQIPGLYAAGNCSSPVMGRTYPGAGSTLGPATTFGYVAARDAIAGG